MKQAPPAPPARDPEDEVAALIATLHATGRRLEELTAGEVDSVTGADGRPFMLQRAQDHVREAVAARQERILDALPAHIALLDPRGVITSVNAGWRQFSIDNGLDAPDYAVGASYLGVCDRAHGAGSPQAAEVAAGIREVLEGAPGFSLEYPCHSPTQERWFLMSVTSLGEAPARGAVVMHVNISERRRSEERAIRFAAAMDSVADAIYLIDRATLQLVHVNEAACQMQGLSREALLALGPGKLLSLPRHELERSYDAIIASRKPAEPVEMLRTGKDGTRTWVELRRHAHWMAGRWMIVTLVRDITRRKEIDDRVERLHRVQAVLSGTNALIVRNPAHDELLAEACRIAVGQGELRMAWIGLVEEPDGALEPIAAAGDVGDFFTSAAREFGDSRSWDFGIAGRAVREMRPTISNDVSRDPDIMLKQALADRRINSVACIPLVVEGKAAGAMSLYSEDMGFFNAEEMRPLLEMAANIALALEHIDKQEKLERTTRVNAMLSDINGAIGRIRDRQALFDEACRIAVETGGLPFAWICMADRAEQRCKPMAWAGTDHGYLDLIRERLLLADDSPAGYALSARAVRGNVAQVANDIESDPSIKFRKEFGQRGVRSMASLPLSVGGKAVGAFELYSDERGFFDAGEMKLLNEVAANIAFALDHIEKEEKVRRLTRVHSVLSGINALIVRATTREELLREASRIAVEHGRFAMAWVAMLEKSTGALEPVASAGDVGDFFDTSHLAGAHNRAGGHGLPGRAVREMKPMISNDVARDAGILRKAQMQARGIKSAAHIPLVAGGAGIGVLALYSAEEAFFDEEEMHLLLQLGSDISRAIDHLDKHERLEYLAYYDALTGLPNRSLFLGRVAQGMLEAASGGKKLALLLVDLERFKNINDTLGRLAGDTLLKAVAQWLTRRVGDAQLVARLGADHFAVVLPLVRRERSVARLLERTMKAFLDHPFELGEGAYRIASRVGVAMFPNDGSSADMLFEHAEAALKKAKASGERVRFYKPSMTDSMAGKLTLENQLRRALDHGEFVLHYQPKVGLASGKLTGAEALIRWNDPGTGLVPPGRFIPILEETGLIHDVGRWALRQAIKDYLRWRAAGLPAVRIAVNVSPLQLRSRGFANEIRAAIGAGGHAAAGLELEITESLIMEDVKHSIAALQAVRAMDVTVAIDDFGTGFSSLSYLAKLPVDTVKIDRSFVNDMALAPEGLALVSTIIGLAHSLRLKVVAEGVETAEQSRLLRLLDCDEMQGFLLSKALPAVEFEERFLVTPPAGIR